MTLAAELRSTFLFEHLTDDQLAWRAQRTVEERHPEGATLFSEGEPATELWILLEGQVQLTKRVAGEDVVLVTSEQHGAYLGAIRSFVRASTEENYGNTARLLRGGLGRLGAARVEPHALTRLADLAGEAAGRTRTAEPLSSVEAGDREEELGDWLDGRGDAEGSTLASALVEAGLDAEFLERLEEATGPSGFEPGLRWLTDVLTATTLVGNIQEATGRISELVGAVKDYTWMDRAAVQEVDVHDGTASTLTMLRNKLKQGIEVERAHDRDLPHVRVYPGELNQVWTNLIDNAVDAMDGQGTLRIATARRRVPADRGRRRGRRHPPRRPVEDLRAVLHDRGRRQGHRPGPSASSTTATTAA